jgi:serine/threonine protein kinase
MTTPMSPESLALQEVLAGRYSIERELGRGGMGIVLLARDVALDRPVAIKLLPLHLATDPDARERFLQEARTAAGLSHPNIVPIHLVEARGELVFFVMGYVDGETLRERVERSGSLTPRLAMKLLQEVAWALAYAHQRGVIHRDVKPDNIMIERATDRALVTDFGIALGTRDANSAGGPVMGTARYMSPEQACGEPVDARSDLYSLGASFFYALTGRAPFEGSNLPAILAKQVAEPAPLVQVLRPEVPAKLAAVIDRCLKKAPADRLQSGDDLARVVGEARGRDFRAPPLVRAFIRNAQVSTMVLLAMALAGQTVTASRTGITMSFGGPG